MPEGGGGALVVLFFILLIVVIFVWAHFGFVWGIVAAVVLLTPPGLALLSAPLLAWFRPGFITFEKEWEQKFAADPNRPASAISGEERAALLVTYREWRSNGHGVSAREFLQSREEQLASVGVRRRLAEGEVRVLGSWRFDIWGYTDGGGWTPSGGDHYQAVRTLSWEQGEYMGMNSEREQVESCPHAHEDREDAQPCVDIFKRFSRSAPTPEDVGRSYILVKAPGTYWHDGSVTEGRSVGLHRFGVLVPMDDVENGLLMVDWPDVNGFWVADGKVGVDLQGDMPRSVVAVPADEGSFEEWRELLRLGGVTEVSPPAVPDE